MELNYEYLIKQEFLSTEQQLLNVLSDADTNIKVKNEPILDEDPSIVTIKNEPLVEASFADNLTVKTENQLENHIAPLVDSFIIYELETQQHNKQIQSNAQIEIQQNQLLPYTNVQTNHLPSLKLNENFREIENKHLENTQLSYDCSEICSPQLLSNSTLIKNISLKLLQQQQSSQLSPTKELTANTKTTITLAPAAPILLNTKLRKRNKNVLPVSLLDKRTRYNIEGTLPNTANINNQNASEISSLKQATNTGCKKIINHIIQHKRVQRQHRIRLNETKSNRKDTVKPIPQKPPCDSANLILNPNDLIKLKVDDAELKIFFPVKSPVIYTPAPIGNQTSNLNISCTTHTENIAKKSDINIPTASQSNERLLSPKDSPATTTPELRVKCLCRLTDDASQTSDNSELTEFFKQMFEKTRRLTKKQQRNVRMSLLQAISDAEDAVDQGKCCL